MYKLQTIVIILLVLAAGLVLSCSKDSSTGPSTSLSLDAYSPGKVIVGAKLTLTGKNFGTKRDSSAVIFNDVQAATYISWSDVAIVVVVPPNIASGTIKVKVGDKTSNALSFTPTSRSFRAIIEGELFEATSVTVDYQEVLYLKKLAIEAVNGETRIYLNIANPVSGNPYNFSNDPVGTNATVKFQNRTYQTMASGSGAINLSEYDAVTRLASGAFTIRASWTGLRYVNVTGGVFENLIW